MRWGAAGKRLREIYVSKRRWAVLAVNRAGEWGREVEAQLA